MNIKIAIADDHPVVTEGLSKLLGTQKHFTVLAAYGSGKALLDGLEQQQPDVLLLDIHFPDANGNDLIRIISSKYPEIRVLALSSVEHIGDIKDMMQHGCSGYLLKNVTLPVLIEAIEKVHDGEEFMEPELKEQLLNALLRKTPQKQFTGELTQREQKILELIAQGQTNMQIAKKLFLSYRTIQNNRLSLYQKLDVHNTPELIKEALQQGLIE